MQDFALARRAMIDSQLRPEGVIDRGVLDAMASVPREQFVPDEARAFAYFDRAIPVEDGAMLPPTALARLLDAAAPLAGERALVVGAAPDYATAVLLAIGLLASGQIAGAAHDAPAANSLDLIVIEGAVAELPQPLVDALKPTGRLVTAMVDQGVTRLSIGRKVANVVGITHFADSEVAPLAAFARPVAFTF